MGLGHRAFQLVPCPLNRTSYFVLGLALILEDMQGLGTVDVRRVGVAEPQYFPLDDPSTKYENEYVRPGEVTRKFKLYLNGLPDVKRRRLF